ncbi:type II secretion system protein [Enterovibrio qingdaonensis]|uniref:type II secretion system protein n=1 Tax=Enterovibrio qingdaonensis TaxID=2899818 RepID=UPI00236433AE|nr:type II secretion system protein [Enterovibrio sp. ZSDZ35]
MKRQGGFTLIEMIVVIVILGILAVSAAPKFLSFTSEAKVATLQGVNGALLSAASITNAAAQLEGKADGTLTNGGVKVANYFPTADADGILKAVDISGDLKELTTAPTGTDIAWGFDAADTTCYVGYKAAASGGVATTKVEDTCS